MLFCLASVSFLAAALDFTNSADDVTSGVDYEVSLPAVAEDVVFVVPRFS